MVGDWALVGASIMWVCLLDRQRWCFLYSDMSCASDELEKLTQHRAHSKDHMDPLFSQCNVTFIAITTNIYAFCLFLIFLNFRDDIEYGI